MSSLNFIYKMVDKIPIGNMTSVRIQLCFLLVIGARMNRNNARTVLSDRSVCFPEIFLYNAHRKQQTGPYTQYAILCFSTGCFWQLVGHNNV